MACVAACVPSGLPCCAEEEAPATLVDTVRVFNGKDEVFVDAHGSPNNASDEVSLAVTGGAKAAEPGDALFGGTVISSDAVQVETAAPEMKTLDKRGEPQNEASTAAAKAAPPPVKVLQPPSAPAKPEEIEIDSMALRGSAAASSASLGVYDYSFSKRSLTSKKSLEEPMSKLSVMNLSGFLTGKASPEFRHVEAWFWTMSGGDNRPLVSSQYFLMVTLMLVLNWGISAVLACAGLFFAWLYREGFDWDESYKSSLIFGILGGIFTGWNIAQYASFTIQTTGHLTFRQHLRAIAWVAPVLAPCNLLGWCMGALVLATPLVDMPVPVIILVVAGPPIAMGIATKTLWKLRYLAAHAQAMGGQAGEDSLGKRLRVEALASGAADIVECPFNKIGAKLWGKHFLAPFMCFLWTVVYVIGLRKGYVWAGELDEVPRSIAQVTLFLLSLAATALGMKLLISWVDGSSGYFGYNHQMFVAFIVIYALVSDVQVRLGIVKMHGWIRLACAVVQPAYASILRGRMSLSWHKSMKGSADFDDHMLVQASNKEPRLVIMCMGIIIAQNISSIVLSGTTCLFEGVSGFSLGACDAGLGMQILQDAAATWLFDVVSIYVWVQKGMPVLYFFSMLDPFLTIAAILVVYMCTILALLTACIQ